MITREGLERQEYERLSPFAAKSAEAGVRGYPEEKCHIRTEFQRDRDRIIHSKAFRRLMHKTQVFLAPEGDHFRTRLTHTIEVSQIARTIARGLALNEDLTEAIALGHDLGHTPFGHSGESVLDRKHPGGFRHNEQSLRVVDLLEGRKGEHERGLNLTPEVRDGILNHTGDRLPKTLEGQIVRISDRIAYINHDIDDAIRSGVIAATDLPQDCLAALGFDHRSRIDTLVRNLMENSTGKSKIEMSDACRTQMEKLRGFMFEEVYHSSRVKKVEDLEAIERIILALYAHYGNHPEQLPPERRDMIEAFGVAEVVKDHVAGMTDRYARQTYETLSSQVVG